MLSVGDPGSDEKLHVTDTAIVSLARKIDNKIKSYPELKKHLVRVRNGLRKIKNSATKKPIKTAGVPEVTSTNTTDDLLPLAELVKDIELKKHTKPTISIIIPAFNKAEYSYKCIQSLATRLAKDSPSFEVILVDNGSSDNTQELKKIKNLVYVHNKENLGFVGGCNSGIPHAKGEFIIFLNNDTEVTDTWLSSLYTTITSDEGIGLVGSKIIYPNGLLQEAGGIIFQDANGLNYGKFDQASSYQYNYVRDVDYCSGASVIIRKTLLDEFGGFDTLYQPAYYEDTDLSFKVRQKGLRVVYQPQSVLYHIEGGTAGTDTGSGFKRFQVINKEKFLKRWKETLLSDHVLEQDWYLGRDRSGNKLALIIEEALPTPDKDSGSVRMMAMIKSLQSLGYKVTFWPNNLTETQPYATNLQQMGVEVVYGAVDFMQFARLYGHAYDAVIMSRPEICAKYLNICKNLFNNAKLIYDTVDLHYVRLARQGEIEQAEHLTEQAKWYEILEKGLMERVDATLVVSNKEKALLEKEGLKNISIISNIHSIKNAAYDTEFSERKDIVFVGNYAHLPNIDAIKWYVKDIFPNVLKKLPGVRLIIVGANMPDNLRKELRGDNIDIQGFVSDEALADILTNARLFIAPLRYGAGVKGKIGQAIEYGLPVVTTKIGSEGMYLEDNISCKEADDEALFTAACLDLYRDEKLWKTIQGNARNSLQSHFSIENAVESFKKLLA